MAPATDELRENPPSASADPRTLYSIACLYSCAAERVEIEFLPLAWEFLGRSVLATSGSAEWDLARIDPELALLSGRARFLDDLSRTWSMRRARSLPPLVGSLAEAEVFAALGRLSTSDRCRASRRPSRHGAQKEIDVAELVPQVPGVERRGVAAFQQWRCRRPPRACPGARRAARGSR